MNLTPEQRERIRDLLEQHPHDRTVVEAALRIVGVE